MPINRVIIKLPLLCTNLSVVLLLYRSRTWTVQVLFSTWILLVYRFKSILLLLFCFRFQNLPASFGLISHFDLINSGYMRLIIACTVNNLWNLHDCAKSINGNLITSFHPCLQAVVRIEPDQYHRGDFHCNRFSQKQGFCNSDEYYSLSNELDWNYFNK